MIEDIPLYANKIYYSLGFLSMIGFFLLIITGIIMVFFGPDWWFTNSTGVFIRSVHLWSAQAFIVFIILHMTIVFLTSGYKAPRQFVWVLGSLMFFLALFEAEFGYVLRNDFSSQWRSLQGADFYNGNGLGRFINNLNYAQIYGIHIIIIPLAILGILFLHYGLVRLRGIAKPYIADYQYRIVKANHKRLFMRGFVLVCLIVLLAFIFPLPIIAPVNIKQIATEDPSLMAKTLIGEIDHSSDTATYLDNIDPYKFDTKKVYVDEPYLQSSAIRQSSVNLLSSFDREDKQTQAYNLRTAKAYFDKNPQINTSPIIQNPVIPIVSTLILMGQSGLYESSLKNESSTGYNPTYVLRFLSDTGILEDKAITLSMTTKQYGMLREGKSLVPGAWWLAPLGFLDNTVLLRDDNQDRDGAEILGIFMLLVIAFPYLPFVNKIPDKLGIHKLIWRDRLRERS